jgi:hypothetical protein
MVPDGGFCSRGPGRTVHGMTTKSVPDRDEPVHVFDQTNGVLHDDEAPEGRPARVGGAPGDVPVATGILLNGLN